MTMSPPFFGAQPPLHPRHSPGLALPHGAVPALAHLPTTPRGIDDWNARLRTRSEAFHLEDAAEWAHARSRSDTFSLRAPHPHPHAHPTPAHDYFALPATGPATGPASPRSPGVRVLFTPPHLSSAHPLPHAEHNPALPRFPSLDIPLLREIGTGAFATVYEGRIGSRRCAVKVVRKSLLTPKQRSDVLKEVSLLRRLDHPHIVKLLEFGEGRIAVDSAVGQDGEKEGYYYLVMELMVGGELFSRVQEVGISSEAGIFKRRTIRGPGYRALLAG